MLNFCMDRAYLLFNGVNGIGVKNFSSQLRAELHCTSPIIYRLVCIQCHLFISCELSPNIRDLRTKTVTVKELGLRLKYRIYVKSIYTSYVYIHVGQAINLLIFVNLVQLS